MLYYGAAHQKDIRRWAGDAAAFVSDMKVLWRFAIDNIRKMPERAADRAASIEVLKAELAAMRDKKPEARDKQTE